MTQKILGIDATTGGSGGAKRHLLELLSHFSPEKHGFSKIKIWGVESLLSEMPKSDFVETHTHKFLNKGLFHRLLWQIFYRSKEFKGQFDILFSPFGTYRGSVKPFVSMSRNMLIFDQSQRKLFGYSFTRLKLKLLYYVQKSSFKKAKGIIFISDYAYQFISRSVNLANKFLTTIPHGISSTFDSSPKEQYTLQDYSFENPLTLLYVSSVLPYKHQWNVVNAVANLREEGQPINLKIVGNDDDARSGQRLLDEIQKRDPQGQFTEWIKRVGLNEINKYYQDADVFIFASSCENMPNILIESMRSGLPILSSIYEPMPEFLKDAGEYFDPFSVEDIQRALKKFIFDPKLRTQLSHKSYQLSKQFSWDKCADKTFDFLLKLTSSKEQ